MAEPGLPQEWVGQWSEKRATLTPDRVALVDATTGERYSYATLDSRANQAARLLRQCGVGQGNTVAVVSRNRPEVVDLFFATGKIGSVLAPLSYRLTPPELGELLARIEPAALIVESRFLQLVTNAFDATDIEDCLVVVLADDENWAAEDAGFTDTVRWSDARSEDSSPVETATVAPTDPHLLLHTGGSTGTPKETIITHRGIVWNSLNTITAWGLRDDDVTPMVFPLFHTGGWNVITIPLWHMGGTVLIAREFDPATVLRVIESEGATVLIAVPAVLRAMTMDDQWASSDLSTLRFVKSGGGACRESVMEKWWSRNVDLSQGYGLTECGPNNFGMPDDWPAEKADSVGKPALHVDVRIVTEGTEVEDGTIGELELRSPHAADGYLDSPDETAATFGADGWIATGDLARVDDDGYVHIEGRKKDMFVSGGENVYPAEVESAIAAHPAIQEVVVIPIPDEQWGQVGRAVVQSDEDITLESLRAFLDDCLARFKHPRSMVLTDEFPMAGPSKIDRKALLERFGE